MKSAAWIRSEAELAAIYGEMGSIHETPRKEQTAQQTERLKDLRAACVALHERRILLVVSTPLPSDATSADFATWLMGSITGGGITEEAVQKWWHDYCLECEATPVALQAAPVDPFTAEEKQADPQLYLHPEQYERREDGKVVRKDRWEIGIRNAWTALGGVREPFEIEDVVDAVRRLAKALPETSRPLTKAERAMLCFVESLANDFSAEDWRLHGFSPKTYDNLKRKLSVL